MSTKIEREKEDLFYKNLKKDIELKEILQKLIKIDGEKSRIEIYKKHLEKILKSIKENGIKCGLAINPDTKIQKLYPFLEIIDMVIIMSVFPGKGGQKFIENTYDKVETLRNHDKNIDISVDGGVSSSNSKTLISKGASTLVSGSYLMKSNNINNSIKNMLKH